MTKWTDKEKRDDRELTVNAINTGIEAFGKKVEEINDNQRDIDTMWTTLRRSIGLPFYMQGQVVNPLPASLNELRERFEFQIEDIEASPLISDEKRKHIESYRQCTESMLEAVSAEMGKASGRGYSGK